MSTKLGKNYYKIMRMDVKCIKMTNKSNKIE